MQHAHVLVFVRVLIGVIFAVSASGKLRDIRAFRAAVEDFRLVPRRLAGIIAVVLAGLEAALVVTMAAGGVLLPFAFVGAAFLLAAFSVALAIALRRHSVLSCKCFGSATTRLSGYDLGRNLCLIACAGLGAWAALVGGDHSVPASQFAVTALVACGLALVLVNFADVAKTLLRPFTVPGEM